MQAVVEAALGREHQEASQQAQVAQAEAAVAEMVTQARTSQEVRGQLT
jgi:hypothetical protein